MNPMSFFGELKRRNVYKVAVAYIVAGWALSQGIAQVFPVFDVPNWVIRLIVLLIIIGFPIALVLAWAFELTPEGLKRTEDADLAAQPRAKSIAVLPFGNLSRDPDNEYFAAGIQDEIITRLAQISDLKVISCSSTQRYKGSVQKANDEVHVNVQLLNALTDSHLWADTFDRKLTDVFGVETEIAKTVADTLRAKLTGREA